MEPDYTLLRQIRTREEELSERIRRAETEAGETLARARAEAEALICTADAEGATTAEQVYWKERARTEAEIEEMKRSALLEREMIALQGEKNLPAAAGLIVRYVTLEE